MPAHDPAFWFMVLGVQLNLHRAKYEFTYTCVVMPASPLLLGIQPDSYRAKSGSFIV